MSENFLNIAHGIEQPTGKHLSMKNWFLKLNPNNLNSPGCIGNKRKLFDIHIT